MDLLDYEWQNRDNNTHMGITWNDISYVREQSNWEKDLVEAEINNLEHEPDLEQ